MHNMLYLIGRIESIKSNKDKTVEVVLKVCDTIEDCVDTIKIILKDKMGELTKDNCKKGSLIGIRGKIKSNDKNDLYVQVEKISFLSSAENNKEK